LDSTFAQEKSQCGGNSIWVLTKLFGQIALADDDLPSWVALMDFASVGRNPIGECAKFFLPVTLRTLDFGFFGFETPYSGSKRSIRSTSAVLSTKSQPRRNSSWVSSTLRSDGNRIPAGLRGTKITEVLRRRTVMEGNSCEKSPTARLSYNCRNQHVLTAVHSAPLWRRFSISAGNRISDIR
jgi:hypothetical protein